MHGLTLAMVGSGVLIAARRISVPRDRMGARSAALVPCAVNVLTCAVTIIWAFREVFVYEFDHFGTGKDVPVLRS